MGRAKFAYAVFNDFIEGKVSATRSNELSADSDSLYCGICGYANWD